MRLGQHVTTGVRDGVARIQLLADLRLAIDERTLELVYQPKFALATGTAVGVEALIRWPHPEFGMLEPADFLPLVRENGLMEALTEVVLDRAVGDAAGWYRRAWCCPSQSTCRHRRSTTPPCPSASSRR